MNLAALWTHERARVGTARRAPLLDGDEDHAEARRPPLKRQSSNSGLASPASSSAATAAAAGTAKKKTSTAQRESAYKKLIEESALPEPARPHFEANEFAMEYADRAPRRFVQQQPHHAVDATGSFVGSESTTTATTVDPPFTKLHRHKSSTPLQPVAAGTVPKATTAVVANVLPRRNPRKRGGNNSSLELATHAFRPYVGDMFGTRGDYVEGMLYMSRMKRSHQLTFGHDGPMAEFAPAGRGSALKDAVADAFSAAVAVAAAGNLIITAGDSTGLGVPVKGGPSSSSSSSSSSSPTLLERNNPPSSVAATLLSEVSPEEILQLRLRQRCSLTLSNWSSNPENARLMVQENVVEALILLCKASDGDRVTKLHCVTTLMNLSHVDALRSELVQQGAVKTLVEIANDTEDDKTLRTACAVTLCNLCCCVEGEEEILVEDGAVGALSLLINEHPKTAAICLGALYNLTCVKDPYHKIESVLKVFVTLASSTAPSSSSVPGSAERDEIIAKAICNLSNFKRVRLRLMEEGIVLALSNLIHPNHAPIQQLLAYVFLNLSAMRACRSELVAKGCLGALIALTGATAAHDGETKSLIASSLWNLSKEPGNRLRMVFEGLLLLVNELCRGGGSSMDRNNETVRTLCARTVYNVSCSEETRLKLVERDAVSILSTLAQRCVGEEGKKMCTLSLCNLLSVQQAAADIVTAGAITSLIELSMVSVPPQTLETRHLFSKALYGLCEMATTRAAVVHAGIIPAIIHLSSFSLPSSSTKGTVGARQVGLLSEIRARCTAALANLAGDDVLSSIVCTSDVARCVVQILVQERLNVAIERICCACLSLLCRDEQCALFVADEGALEAVLSTCLESQDLETKASCCHVLASMSCHRSCCMALVNMGALPVLATLAKTGMSKGSGSTVQRCCAITLANLSAEKEIRIILVTSSIVPLLSLLSNSYSEDSQRDCARVLCNLSSVYGHEEVLVREGALNVLMMISMVRALQPATKETCVRAFANLLTPATVRSMIKEGIVKVLPVFAGLAAATFGRTTGVGDETLASCVIETVSVIFGKLLRFDEGRQALTTESTALRALVSLRPHREEDEESSLFESLLGEFVYYDELRERSVDAGIVEALQQLATQRLARGRPVSRIALMLFTLAKHDGTRQAAASASSLLILGAFLVNGATSRQSDQATILYSVSTVCHLAWHEATRMQLDPHTITQPLTRLLRLAAGGGDAAPSDSATSACLLTLCSVSDSSGHLSAMLQEDILTHLVHLLDRESLDSKHFLQLVSILFRQLSHVPAFEESLTKSVSQSAVAIRLFCLLANRAAVEADRHAALDCADGLCSITFLHPIHSHTASSDSRPVAFVRRQSQPQLALRGAMTAASSIPPAALITEEVLGAICALLSNGHHEWAETRWRCMAALYAFSCISDYRHTLVRLGCSRLFVREATRAVESASPAEVELATLRCCAGGLCNLTIVSGANANVNAQTMIEEDAVPALIQLATRENDEIREYCTLALSNLSTQSPKVESGAVSALLSLSMQVGSSALGDMNSQVGVARPPLVVDARYKAFSSLPDHVVQLELHDEVLSRKYEAAQGYASKPPPPQVPTLSPDLSMVGGLGQNALTSRPSLNGDGADAAVHHDEAVFRRQRSSSIGALMSISLTAMSLSGSSSSRGNSRGFGDGELRGWRTQAFPKIDPVESRALNMEMDDYNGPADPDDASTSANSSFHPAATDSRGSESAQADDTSTHVDDLRSESDELSAKAARMRGAGGGHTISPLAQVVVRKAQTSRAISKLKTMKAPGVRGATSSTSSLPLATVEEIQETRAESSRRISLAQVSAPKVNCLHKIGTPKSLPLVQALSPSAVVSPLQTSDGLVSTEPSSVIAAAAAAALLYTAAPPSPIKTKPNGDAATTRKAKSKSKPVKSKRPAAPAVDEETSRVRAPAATTIQDVQAQVKLLGLWN